MKKTFIMLSLCSILLIGCNKTETITQITETTTKESVIRQEPKQIITSFYPLAFIAEKIGGDQVAVTNLAGSVSPHKYQLTPQDRVKLNNADLVLVQGTKLEPWAEEVLMDLESKNVLTLEIMKHLDLYELNEKAGHEDEEEEEEEEPHDEHEGEDTHEDNHDKHDHGQFDPHTWLSPELSQVTVDEILEVMITMNPENKATFEANATALKAQFQALDNNFKASLANCKLSEVIISHDAYGYLARSYNFETHAIAGMSATDEPSAQILAMLKEEAKEGITHILVEQNSVKKFADTLASETGLLTLNVNPLGRGTLDDNKDFFNIMDENLASFKTALNCE